MSSRVALKQCWDIRSVYAKCSENTFAILNGTTEVPNQSTESLQIWKFYIVIWGLSFILLIMCHLHSTCKERHTPLIGRGKKLLWRDKCWEYFLIFWVHLLSRLSAVCPEKHPGWYLPSIGTRSLISTAVVNAIMKASVRRGGLFRASHC